jgi:hypothetical protein
MDFLNYFVAYDEKWGEGGSAFRAWAKVILDSPFLHVILASVDGLLGRPWFTRMYGEAVKGLDEGKARLQDFELI